MAPAGFYNGIDIPAPADAHMVVDGGVRLVKRIGFTGCPSNSSIVTEW